ncbi:MAG TPA: ferredoxin [Candidatus Limnocylindria bacterium]|nr:ferredoxin [Candidatus Limnocylindria bacterium]
MITETRLPQNAAGAFYVTDGCIDCDLCRDVLPTVFSRDEGIGMTIVYQQPQGEKETADALDAVSQCPADAIRADGR